MVRFYARPVVQFGYLSRTFKKYGKSVAQVILIRNLQKGIVTIPKSVKKERISANADIFDFEITAEAVAYLDSLNRGERIGSDPNNFDFNLP